MSTLFKVTVAKLDLTEGPQYWVYLTAGENEERRQVPSVHKELDDAIDQGHRWATFLDCEMVDWSEGIVKNTA